MPSRREFHLVLAGAVLCGTYVISSFRLGMEDGIPTLTPASAAAKDGKGKGEGGGRGKGQDKGQDKGGGSGNKGNGSGKGPKDKGGSTMEGSQQVNPMTGDRVRVDGANIEVVHRNGMRERIYRSDYKMTDSRGRTIIERRATGADLARLRRLAG
jgi:hypothetical protein